MPFQAERASAWAARIVRPASATIPRIENAAGSADGEHAANPGFARGDVDTDLDEVRAEGRLREALVEVTELDRVLRHKALFARDFAKGDAARS